MSGFLMRGFMLGGDMETLPCPFCGSDDTVTIEILVGGRDNVVRCMACNANGPITERKQAVSKWNAVAEVLDAVQAETGFGG